MEEGKGDFTDIELEEVKKAQKYFELDDDENTEEMTPEQEAVYYATILGKINLDEHKKYVALFVSVGAEIISIIFNILHAVQGVGGDVFPALSIISGGLATYTLGSMVIDHTKKEDAKLRLEGINKFELWSDLFEKYEGKDLNQEQGKGGKS